MNRTIILKDLKEIYQEKIDWKRFSGKTVLITGAYGMLASYVTYMLFFLTIEKGINVHIIAVVRSGQKFASRFEHLLKSMNVTVIESNLDMPLVVEGAVDYIIHAASLASPNYYSICPVDVLMPNIIGTKYLLDLAVEKRSEGFLYFSSSDIYGKVIGKEWITEDTYGIMDTRDEHSCYSESKRMAETMCMAWWRQKQVPIKIARIWHTYGPTMDVTNDPRVFASFVGDILADRDIIMMSNGLSKRSFCYITDAVAAYFMILLNGEVGSAYNVCRSDQFISISDLAYAMVGIYPEKQLKVVKRYREEKEPYLENHMSVDIPPSDKKIKGLGWKPKISIEEGFFRVLEYLK